MRVLLYSISYSPEVAGSGRFNGELSAWLAEEGHKVDVITAHPYYPEWKIRAEYKNRYWFSEKKGNLTVYRTPLYVPSKVTGITRILHELSFVINSLIYWIRLSFNKYDVLIGVCPPLQIGLLPYIFGKIKRVPFIFHVQDLQVDAAKNLGLIKNKHLLDILEKIEGFLLRNATKVSSISEGMRRNIIGKGVSPDNYVMLENWVDISAFQPISVENSLKSELGFKVEDKIALYAGNIGEKQGLEVLVDAANILKEEKHIKIVVFGEGAARDRLMKLAEKLKLSNLLFFPIRPYEEMPKVLAMADVHLVVQKRAASDLVMPSKLVGILASGGASIVSADKNTSLSDIIINNKLGWVVDPENGISLARTISNALISKDLKTFKLNARRYSEEHLSQNFILPRFQITLKNLASSNSSKYRAFL